MVVVKKANKINYQHVLPLELSHLERRFVWRNPSWEYSHREKGGATVLLPECFMRYLLRDILAEVGETIVIGSAMPRVDG